MKLMDTFPILGHIAILPLHVMVITPGFLTSAVFVVVCVFFLHWRLNTCGHTFYHWTNPSSFSFKVQVFRESRETSVGEGRQRGFPACLWSPCSPGAQVTFGDLILNSFCPSFQDQTAP